MNLFFRDFTAASPIASGSQWLAALGGRIAYSIARAVYGRLTSVQAWVVALLMAGWFATSAFPATAGLAAVVNAILIGFGALGLLKNLREIGAKLLTAISAAYSANNEQELEAASLIFADAMDEYALNALSAIVNQATFKKIEKAVIAVFPIPDWFAGIYNQGIFVREFDASKPVVSGARWLAALAARIALAFVDALHSTEIGRQLAIGVRQIWLLALLLAGWVVASLIPATAPVVDAINAILLAIGLLSLLDRAKEVGAALSTGLSAAYLATNDRELEEAGRRLAPAITGVVVTAIEVIVVSRAFAAAESLAVGRFPVPEVLAKRWARYREGGGGGKKVRPADEPKRTPSETEGAQKRQSRNPEEGEAQKRQSRNTDGEGAPRKGEVAGALKRAAQVARVEGGRKIADPSSELAVGLIVGGVIVVGVTATVVALNSRGTRK